MDKRAATEHLIHDLLAKRWSPRAFESRPVPESELARLFEGARWTASSNNEQPWTYVLATKAGNPELFDLLASVLVPGNSWAKNVPVLALSVVRTHFASNQQLNRVAVHDVGAASASLSMQATAQGLYVHQMAGFDTEKAKQVLGIPEGYEPVAMMAIGYLGDADDLPEPLRSRELAPRMRKKIDEFVVRGKWGDTKKGLRET